MLKKRIRLLLSLITFLLVKIVDSTGEEFYFKLANYNYLNFSQQSDFLLSSFEYKYKLKCLSKCRQLKSNSKCKFVLFEKSKCFLCHQKAIKYLIRSNDGDTELFKLNDGINLNYKPSDGLANYWPFNDNFNDYIGGADLFNGVNVGLIADSSGKERSALGLSNGYYQMPNGVYFDGSDFSVMVWLRPKAAFTNFARIIEILTTDLLDAVQFSISLEGNPTVYMNNNGQQVFYEKSSAVLTLNQWQHLAWSFGSQTMSFYVNGQLQSSGPAIGVPKNIIRNYCFIGRSIRPSTEPDANHDLDELRIFRRALSREQITYEMNFS